MQTATWNLAFSPVGVTAALNNLSIPSSEESVQYVGISLLYPCVYAEVPCRQ
jgi:hypothetical protein